LKNIIRVILLTVSVIFIIAGITLLTGWFEIPLSTTIATSISRRASPNWAGYFKVIGVISLFLGIAISTAHHIIAGLNWFRSWLHSTLAFHDQWLDINLDRKIDLASPRSLKWPLDFSTADWLVNLIFIFLALIFQVAMSSKGFPTVILGGDAANIASFAAGRAFPQLFTTDAILGNLRNIGLYVTIHLPITISLEKILGNFGLAYSVLLFPHVFLQYLSYYLLGRVIFNHRYWAFLFTLAVSAPLALAGGELWGIVGDGMPRFTFQVLIPFVLILLLSAWRNRPERWPWVMIMAGLLAFVHPVSTPAWAFALWLGLWPCLPSLTGLKEKLLIMLKMGIILALALLPYASIYLYYHQGGGGNSNYDLVYYILTNYFPYELIDIPAAVITLLKATSEFGLLWYGLVGLAVTFLLFRSERSRLSQMLIWMAGISFVTIIFPFIEQTIERSLRIIPLQTELMRGMRYLVPFLFIFWFYPLAEITNRANQAKLSRIIILSGTLMTLFWLFLNPPLPFVKTPAVFQCWATGQFICPTETDYADALIHIRDQIPENAKFVVFLQNRWSGIEVRYIGLHPMAYAYKDRGQLAFTNLEALQTWFYYIRRENAIFSRSNSPTLDIKQQRIIDFARDAEANYLLTDFSFSKEVLEQFQITTAYRNKTFTILKIYNMR